MRRRYFLPPLISVFLLVSTLAHGQAWSGILATKRAIDWSYSGIPGGIPSGSWADCLTSQCNTLWNDGVGGAQVTASNINSALSSAPNNTVVRIPSGIYTLSTNVYTNRSNVTLRGTGPTQTKLILNGHNILFGSGTNGQGSYAGGLTVTNLSTYSKGSTVLTVASSTGMSANQVVQIDQRNDSFINITGNEGSENPGRCESPLSFQGCTGNRAQLELVQIQSVDSSTQITIEGPGLSHDYSASLSPQIFFWSNSGVASNAGVENLTVDAGDGSSGHAATNFAVALSWCNFCWTKNVAVINGHRAALYSLWSYRVEIRDSYVSESNQPGAPTEYGIECDACSLAKIENNILFGVTTPIILETSYGVVIGYNYMLNTSSGNQFPNQDMHRAHNFLELSEGNVVGTLAWDFIWGGSSQNTSFRDRISGNDPNKTNYQLPVADAAYNRYENIIGDVLGDPTFHKTYQCDNNNLQSSNNFIFEIGFYNRCELGTTNYDKTVGSSLVRWGNWDAVTWKSNGNTNGVRWCTGSGAGNPACTGSETASSDPTFPGLASPSTTLPASFYTGVTAAFPSCGTGLSFWKNPTTGTCPPYPPIGPDVNCSTNCNANTANHAALIPAQVCYNNTAKDGNGYLTAFDANACYTNDPSSTADDPAPPTGLSAVVE